MKTRTSLWLLPLCLLLMAGGCDKDNDGWVKATIVNLGEQGASSDGCGWAVLINNELTFSESLDDQYKVHGLKVKIIYENTSQSFSCPFSSEKYPVIAIKQIKR